MQTKKILMIFVLGFLIVGGLGFLKADERPFKGEYYDITTYYYHPSDGYSGETTRGGELFGCKTYTWGRNGEGTWKNITSPGDLYFHCYEGECVGGECIPNPVCDGQTEENCNCWSEEPISGSKTTNYPGSKLYKTTYNWRAREVNTCDPKSFCYGAQGTLDQPLACCSPEGDFTNIAVASDPFGDYQECCRAEEGVQIAEYLVNNACCVGTEEEPNVQACPGETFDDFDECCRYSEEYGNDCLIDNNGDGACCSGSDETPVAKVIENECCLAPSGVGIADGLVNGACCVGTDTEPNVQACPGVEDECCRYSDYGLQCMTDELGNGDCCAGNEELPQVQVISIPSSTEDVCCQTTLENQIAPTFADNIPGGCCMNVQATVLSYTNDQGVERNICCETSLVDVDIADELIWGECCIGTPEKPQALAVESEECCKNERGYTILEELGYPDGYLKSIDDYKRCCMGSEETPQVEIVEEVCCKAGEGKGILGELGYLDKKEENSVKECCVGSTETPQVEIVEEVCCHASTNAEIAGELVNHPIDVNNEYGECCVGNEIKNSAEVKSTTNFWAQLAPEITNPNYEKCCVYNSEEETLKGAGYFLKTYLGENPNTGENPVCCYSTEEEPMDIVNAEESSVNLCCPDRSLGYRKFFEYAAIEEQFACCVPGSEIAIPVISRGTGDFEGEEKCCNGNGEERVARIGGDAKGTILEGTSYESNKSEGKPYCDYCEAGKVYGSGECPDALKPKETNALVRFALEIVTLGRYDSGSEGEGDSPCTEYAYIDSSEEESVFHCIVPQCLNNSQCDQTEPCWMETCDQTIYQCEKPEENKLSMVEVPNCGQDENGKDKADCRGCVEGVCGEKNCSWSKYAGKENLMDCGGCVIDEGGGWFGRDKEEFHCCWGDKCNCAFAYPDVIKYDSKGEETGKYGKLCCEDEEVGQKDKVINVNWGKNNDNFEFNFFCCGVDQGIAIGQACKDHCCAWGEECCYEQRDFRGQNVSNPTGACCGKDTTCCNEDCCDLDEECCEQTYKIIFAKKGFKWDFYKELDVTLFDDACVAKYRGWFGAPDVAVAVWDIGKTCATGTPGPTTLGEFGKIPQRISCLVGYEWAQGDDYFKESELPGEVKNIVNQETGANVFPANAEGVVRSSQKNSEGPSGATSCAEYPEVCKKISERTTAYCESSPEALADCQRYWDIFVAQEWVQNYLRAHQELYAKMDKFIESEGCIA